MAALPSPSSRRPLVSPYKASSFPTQQINSDEEDDQSPPRREKHQHHSPSHYPPSASTSFSPSDIVVKSSHAASHNRIGFSTVGTADGDETEDEDAEQIGARVHYSNEKAKRSAASGTGAGTGTTKRHLPAGEIEDVCLFCEGNCLCGGIAGVSRPRSLKVRITLAGSSIGSTSTATNHPVASTSTIPYQRSRSTSTNSSMKFDDDRHRPVKKLKSNNKSQSPSSATSSTSTKPKSKPTRKAWDSNDDLAFSASTRRKSTPSIPRSARPLPTPARSSLRQILQASVREVSSSSRDNSPAPSSIQPIRAAVVDSSDSEAEDKIEKAEEKALREEFELGSTGTGGHEGDSSSDDCSDSSEEDTAEGWQDRARDRAEDRALTNPSFRDDVDNFSASSWVIRSRRDKSIGADSCDFDRDVEEVEVDPLVIAEIPPTGGRGVVTWSDYDSVDDSEAEGDVGEFEDELSHLLALSEAVVGPVTEDYELAEMWFEEMSNQGDDESSEDESDADNTVTITDGFRQAVGDSSEDSSDEEDDDEEDSDGHQYGRDFDEDDGDTTDSLDSDDHVGLVRFGIEVDTDSSDESDNEFFNPPPGTISLATVQPPTSADLAALPHAQYLLSSNMGLEGGVEMMIDLNDLDRDPDRAIREAAKGLGVGRGTAARILGGVDRAWLKQGYPSPKDQRLGGVNNEEELKEERDTFATASGVKSKMTKTAGTSSAGPAMGSFMPKSNLKGKGKGTDVNMMIDASDTIAPSPFAKLKKGKKRARDLVSLFSRVVPP